MGTEGLKKTSVKVKKKKKKKKRQCPGWYVSVVWAPACKPKGHQLNSQSGGVREANDLCVSHILMFLSLSFFFLNLFKRFYLFLERGEGREQEKEKNINVWFLSRSPHWGPGLQPRHVPWLGIEPVTQTACAQSTELHQPGLSLPFFLPPVPSLQK